MDNITELIVIIAGICAALTTIHNFIYRPTKYIKDKVDQRNQLEEDELVQTITESVMDQIEPLINEIKQINLEQNRKLDQFRRGQLDLLRQQILYLYSHHQEKQTLTSEERKFLEDLYRDYSDEGGNGYIKALYDKMSTWDIV